MIFQMLSFQGFGPSQSRNLRLQVPSMDFLNLAADFDLDAVPEALTEPFSARVMFEIQALKICATKFAQDWLAGALALNCMNCALGLLVHYTGANRFSLSCKPQTSANRIMSSVNNIDERIFSLQ